ncbi:bacteriocin-associated integral membrane family protein [Austwickia chelonae]|uniref:bacteriocin-associated integral membrane family protein n=1 Tax=Austwickia chelonae TaxID=100225 RepID=UPI0013C2C82A|nr:DUF1430 domain-containing protein [Austwickia chelonae]
MKSIYKLIAPLCFLIAFFCLSATDASYPTHDSPAHVIANGKININAEDAYEKVVSFVRSERITIGRVEPDSTDPGEARTIRLIPSSAPEINQRYPDFSSKMSTKVTPLNLENNDWSGQYLVYGTPGQATEFATQLEQLGLKATAHGKIGLFQMISLQRGMEWAIIGIIAALCATIVAYQFSCGRQYGIKRMNGHAFTTEISRQIKSSSTQAVLSCAASGAASIFFLHLYNQLGQLDTFLWTAAYALVASLSAIFIVHILSAAVAWRCTAILSQVKGRAEGIPLISSSCLVRAPAAGLVISLSTTLALAGAQVTSAEKEHEHWHGENARVGRLIFHGVGSVMTDSESQKKAMDPVERWLAEEDKKSHLVIAHKLLMSISEESRPQNALIINDQYVKRNNIPESLKSCGSDACIAIRSSGSSSKNIRTEIQKAIQFSLNSDFSKKFSYAELEQGSRFFTYDSQGLGISALSEPDFVIRIPDRSLNGDFIASAASSGGVLMTDASEARGIILDSPQLKEALSGISLAGTSSTQKLTEKKREINFTVVGVIGAALTLLATSFSLSIAYSTLYRQRSFIRRIHGWSFMRTYRRVLTCELALWILLGSVFSYLSYEKNFQGNIASSGGDSVSLLQQSETIPYVYLGVLIFGASSLFLAISMVDRTLTRRATSAS